MSGPCPWECDCRDDPGRFTVARYVWPRWKRWLFFWRDESGLMTDEGQYR